MDPISAVTLNRFANSCEEKIDANGRTLNRVVTLLEKLTDKFENMHTRVKAIESDHNKLTHNSYDSFKITAGMLSEIKESQEYTREFMLDAKKKRKREDDDDVSPYKWNQEYKEKCIWMLNSVEDHYPDVYKKVLESFEKRQAKNKWNLSVHNDVYDLTESNEEEPSMLENYMGAVSRAKRAMDSVETNEGLPERKRAYVQTVPNKEPED